MTKIFYSTITTIASLLLFANIAFAQNVATVNTSFNKLSDGNVELLFNIDINDGWYIYGVKEVEFGPLPTSFASEQSDSFEAIGTLEEITPSKKKFDEMFGLDVYILKGSAKFRQIIKPSSDTDFTVKGTLNFQSCDGKQECIGLEEPISIDVKANAQVVETKPLSNSGEKEAGEQSLLLFLLIAFAAGLGGVITPCVFPMIPMTVGFLIGGSNKKTGIMKGLIFGLSVTLIYTALGLIVSLFQSTSATDALGTHWIPNLLFAILFLVFAVSFLGAFEITLPSGLANKADKQADKGGFIAAFFVAFAMVIVSFSCTGPFVGSILAAAVVGGVTLKPILGMAVFGLAFSLPFVLFSFFPSVMKKMPKSGGWLNVVKVVFAVVLLAFAVKFLYNVDAYFGWGIITRVGFLSSWIALSILLALYFFGIIRTNHDSEVKSLGWGRIVAATVMLSFSVYLTTGLFGAPLKSFAGLLPPMDETTSFISSGPTSSSSSSEVATGKYSSIKSYKSIDEAISASKASGKPIFLYFKSHTCGVCKLMESTVLNEENVVNILAEKYVVANLYVDDKTPDAEEKTLGKRIRKYQTEKFSSVAQPLYVVIDSNENTISGPIGKSSIEEFLQFLDFSKGN
jgi:thiol:disulfide interchange protein